ncbi:hypothetical protein AB3X48_13850 [Bacillus sp. S4]|uniref:Lipoprotein n=2 Tax=Bacillus cereus TaxID=1396 RepID=R8QRE8_BACCE|nr:MULTISPECIES: hypothetical protein [Bacillus cereus group]EOP73696.1 hypothetical protein IIQ_05866 [Bacillus cereus VD118]MCQ6360505.1 hypothetical protein [Bacillus cereus]CAH2465997.1 hypothetical protein ACOSJ1_EBGNOMHC_05746 [Bacillus mycoides KBAB4]
MYKKLRKYLILGSLTLVISGCSISKGYDTKQEALKQELKSTSNTDTNKYHALERIIKIDGKIAFFVTPDNYISIADLQMKNGKWTVSGITGGENVSELKVQDSGISPTFGVSNGKVISGYLKNPSISEVSYKSTSGHIINLDKFLPNESKYKGWSLWYIILPNKLDDGPESLDSIKTALEFKDINGTIIKYKN